MRIAVVGSGISGLAAAYFLAERHAVTVFEAGERLGGHTNTVDVERDGQRYQLDTGFLVYNERTYPNFMRLLAHLGVDTQPSEMSFSVSSAATGVEYCGSSLSGLFAARSNLVRPAFFGMLKDIIRFNRQAPSVLIDDDDESLTLGQFVARESYGREFVEHYLFPMGAAIWSAPPNEVSNFPVRYFVRFFANHGLLSLADRPQWRTVCGGAARYIEAMRRNRSYDVRLASPVHELLRRPDCVEVTTSDGRRHRFDHVIVAAHADQALRMLGDPTPAERAVLGNFRFQRNVALLHTDSRLMPRRRRAWASWNYRVPGGPRPAVTVTYWLNRLQSIQSPNEFLVTLNDGGAVDAAAVLRRFVYHHPLYTAASVAAQRRHAEISGLGRTHYCGAYWGYGFHEDGVRSALAVVKYFDEGFDGCTVASTKDESGTAASVR